MLVQRHKEAAASRRKDHTIDDDRIALHFGAFVLVAGIEAPRLCEFVDVVAIDLPEG